MNNEKNSKIKSSSIKIVKRPNIKVIFTKVGEFSLIQRTMQKWNFQRRRSAQGLKSKEKIAANYLFFRFPGQELVILSALLFGPIAYIFSSSHESATNEIDFQKIHNIQYTFIDQYLFWMKIPLIITLSYFIAYRSSKIQKEGTYGYWLSLGTNRSYFYFHAMFGFILNVFVGILIGFALLYFPGGVSLDMKQFFSLLFLLLSSNILLIGIALLFAEIIKIPEIALISFIVSMGLNLVYNRANNNLFSQIFLCEFQFRDNFLLPFLFSLLVGISSIIVALYIHQRKDIEI